MAKIENNPLTELQAKRLKAALVSFGLDSVEIKKLTGVKFRRAVFNAFQNFQDYSFTVFGQGDLSRKTIPFSQLNESIEQIDKGASLVAKKHADEAVIQQKEKGRGKGKGQVKKITSVALEPELLERLNKIAIDQDRSISSLIRVAINFYLSEKHERTD